MIDSPAPTAHMPTGTGNSARDPRPPTPTRFAAQRREGAAPVAEQSVTADPLDALTAAGVSIRLDVKAVNKHVQR